MSILSAFLIAEGARFEYVREIIGTIIGKPLGLSVIHNRAVENNHYNEWNKLETLLNKHKKCRDKCTYYATTYDCIQYFTKSIQPNGTGKIEYNDMVYIGMIYGPMIE